MKTVLTQSLPNVESTKKFARELAEEILSQEQRFVVFLEGGLGVGKTLVVREVLRAFGVQDDVTSPTYTYVQEYTADGANFAHFDLYRLEKREDFLNKGFIEISSDPEISCFVEWPERLSSEAKASFSGKHFVLQLEHGINASGRKAKLLEK